MLGNSKLWSSTHLQDGLQLQQVGNYISQRMHREFEFLHGHKTMHARGAKTEQ